jgi:uncharacterized protein
MSWRISELSIERAAHTLSARLVRPAEGVASERGLLFLHGLRSDQTGYLERAEAAAAATGATCLTFDLAGHGRSTGELEDFTLRDHLGDTFAAYDLLAAETGVDVARIGICAASYGAYLAARTTSERDVKRLLLRAPALYADADLDTPLRTLRSTSSSSDAAILLGELRRYPGSVMVLESERDEVIDKATIDAYVSTFPSVVHELIPGATHSLVEPAWRDTFIELIVSWFKAL